MAKKNKTCLCCQSEYRFCNSCDEFRHAPAWMNSFDTENCAKVFEICSKYSMSLMSKEEAKSALKDCDLSGGFRKDVQGVIDTIKAESKPEPKVEERPIFSKKFAE